MLRNKKAHDVNHGKWIGIGGKMEQGETPEDCAIRETWEETRYRLCKQQLQLQGTVLFDSPMAEKEKIWVYAVDVTKRDLQPNREGTFAWIKQDEILSLPMWEADKVFLKEVLSGVKQPFSYVAVYDETGNLLDLKKGDEA